MIYTVTLNPALDYVTTVDELNIGSVNRVDTENLYPGGKGINVSSILAQLGIESIALGFISGFTGQYIKHILEERGTNTDFIDLNQGFTRINVKLKSKEETEINGQGPQISNDKLEELISKINNLKKEDVLVLAGSIPKSLDENIYEDILNRLGDRGVKVVIDATKNLLLNTLKYKPFLIKPNNHELEEMFEVKLSTEEDIIFYAKKLQAMGAKNVLVSRGKDGAILLSEDKKVYTSSVGKGEVINSVGAGDSMVAGFIGEYMKTKDFEKALKLGSACGSATAFSSDLASKDFIDKIYTDIVVKVLEK